jgi:hypothetical protein
MMRIIHRIEEEARVEGERRARELIADAIQRVASDHVSEITVSSVPLPSDDMKGRIIGRNGRNIRAFEHAAGVDVTVGKPIPDRVVGWAFVRAFARQDREDLVSVKGSEQSRPEARLPVQADPLHCDPPKADRLAALRRGRGPERETPQRESRNLEEGPAGHTGTHTSIVRNFRPARQ